MENQLNNLENKLNDYIKVPFNKIELVENKERIFQIYKEENITQNQLEVATREVILELGEQYEMLKYDISFTISYNHILKENKVIYKALAVQVDENEYTLGKKTIKMPAGTYVTMYFNDSSIDNRKYYNEMINYIQKNNLQVIGDFLETAMVLRVNKDGKENTLAKLEILCK